MAAALLPRTIAASVSGLPRREKQKQRNFAPTTEIWNFHGSSEFAIRWLYVIWANLVVRLPGLQSLRCPHGKATPGNGDASGAKERGEEAER